MSPGHAWLDGRLLPLDEARVRLDDPGLLVGHGIFETMRVERHGGPHPRLLPRHLRRLRRSARIARLNVERSDGELADACRLVIAEERRAAEEHTRGFVRVRVTVTAGGATAVTAVWTREWPDSTTLALVDAPINERSPLRGAKVLAHLEETWCRLEAERLGVGEVVRTDTRGRLSEGSATNLFLVRDGRVLTPSTSTGCLPGITREVVVERFPVVERGDLLPEDLARADEVFVTSSTRGVHPVSAVDGRALTAPGPLTSTIRAQVHEVLRGTS